MRPPNGQRNPSYPPPGSVIPKGMKAVYVRWVDSSTRRGWERADTGELCVIHSVGIEVGRTDDAIILSTSFNSGTMFVDQISIPLAAVQRITRLL